MAKYGKWIGGGLGWALLGPLGGLLGFFVGSVFDQSGAQERMAGGRTTRGDFAVSLLVLVAAVMKADGKVLKSELEYVKKYFVQSFGEAQAQEAMIMLRDILNQQIPLRDVSTQIKQKLDYPSRLQLLHFIYGISQADGKVHPEELKVIRAIAGYMGVSQKDMDSIQSMFYEDTDSSYKILEIDKSATDEEVKKAYRKMATKYHPDKVSYLGEEFRNAAKEKFQKLSEAYENIKKERGMN
ncbi:MAG: TerB family tellurite resistance protein [Bacteroidales bacterium]|nr:TerB family tellurite resistance protein [Bacteroidales bacterium]